MEAILHYLTFLLETVRTYPGAKVEVPLSVNWFLPVGKTQINVEVNEKTAKIEVLNAV